MSAVTKRLFGALRHVGQERYPSKEARTRAILLAYFRALRDNPQSAKVFLLEIHGVSEEVDKAFADGLRSFGEGLARALSPDASSCSSLLQAGVIGGVMHIALQWLSQDFQASEQEAVEAAWGLCSVLTRPSSCATQVNVDAGCS